MRVRIICLGKIREKYLKEGIAEYSKRLGRFCTFEICELPDIKIPDNPSESVCHKVLSEEGEAVLKKISKDSFVIALCVEGKAMSSEELASKMSSVTLMGKSNIVATLIAQVAIDLDAVFFQSCSLDIS